MKVKELIEELGNYNPEAKIEIVKKNIPYEIEEVCFFDDGKKKEKDSSLVSLWVGDQK